MLRLGGPTTPRWTLLALGIWPLLVIPGFVFVERYANAPGKLAEPPATWPASLAVERAAGRSTLVMLAHPRCPCTRASVRELARLMADVYTRVDALVLFVDPVGADWAQTDLWASAAEIPGVRVEADPDGVIARQLGAYTSGQVLLYDAAGRLAFNGGITPARGHEGDNAGRLTISRILDGGADAGTAASTAVFGCDLREPERAR